MEKSNGAKIRGIYFLHPKKWWFLIKKPKKNWCSKFRRALSLPASIQCTLIEKIDRDVPPVKVTSFRADTNLMFLIAGHPLTYKATIAHGPRVAATCARHPGHRLCARCYQSWRTVFFVRALGAIPTRADQPTHCMVAVTARDSVTTDTYNFFRDVHVQNLVWVSSS